MSIVFILLLSNYINDILYNKMLKIGNCIFSKNSYIDIDLMYCLYQRDFFSLIRDVRYDLRQELDHSF